MAVRDTRSAAAPFRRRSDVALFGGVSPSTWITIIIKKRKKRETQLRIITVVHEARKKRNLQWVKKAERP